MRPQDVAYLVDRDPVPDVATFVEVTGEDAHAGEAFRQQIRARLGDETPKGLVSHVAVTREGRLRDIDAWVR